MKFVKQMIAPCNPLKKKISNLNIFTIYLLDFKQDLEANNSFNNLITEALKLIL